MINRWLLYNVRNDHGEYAEFLVAFQDGTAFARACIEREVTICDVRQMRALTGRTVCEDFVAALTKFAADQAAEPA